MLYTIKTLLKLCDCAKVEALLLCHYLPNITSTIPVLVGILQEARIRTR